MEGLRTYSTKSPWTPSTRFQQSRFVVNRLDNMALKSMKTNIDKSDGPASLPCFRINENENHEIKRSQQFWKTNNERNTIAKEDLKSNISSDNLPSKTITKRLSLKGSFDDLNIEKNQGFIEYFKPKNQTRLRRIGSRFSDSVPTEIFSEGPASLPIVISCESLNLSPFPSIGSLSFESLNLEDLWGFQKNNLRNENLPDIKEIDRISITNSQMAEEREICFYDEICQDLGEFPQTANACFSEENGLKNKTEYSFTSAPEVVINPKPNNLLEEIEDDLAKKYSFKKTLSSLYSVAMYRTHMRLSRVLGNKGKADYSSVQRQRKEKNDLIIRKKSENLKKELLFQKMLVDQAAKVINLKKSEQSEKVQAIKACILSSLTYKAVKYEIARVQKVQSFFEIFDLESGFATIKNININVENPETLNSYFFILAAVERDSVKMTEVKEMCDDHVSFQDILQFQDLRQDFIIKLFLYGISMKEKTKPKFYHMSAERLQLIHKKKGTSKMLNEINSSAQHSIVQLGSGQIHSFNMKNKQWQIKSKSRHLNRNITISFQGEINLDAQHSGFLDIKYLGEHILDQFTVWTRFWFQLTGADLKGWAYPSDHTFKEPARFISIAKCTSQQVKPASRSFCVRPNVFKFNFKQDNGIGHQVFCAADSAEEMDLWCYQLNKSIQHYRQCYGV